MDNKKPSTVSQSGRRKSGGSTQLRSPVVKRPSMAPVSLQGWLHKQGSEGLMLWKKRWFVLSEYCLFYYKGPEEEKLLGSILLPSYKVSLCTADDKVYRKFAFKAEHANMRTYYFAAETRELMTQWMNALSLATILQEGAKIQVQPSVTSLMKQNSEDDNSGFQQYRPCSGPITIQPTSQDRNSEEGSGNINGWVPQNPRNPYQPLYANAPPKPKRLNNEGQYGGSSPEASPMRRDDVDNIIYSNRRQFQQAASPTRQQEHHYHPYKTNHAAGALPNPDIVRSMPHSGTFSGDEKRTGDPLDRNNMKSPNFMIRGHFQRNGEGDNYSDVFKGENYNGGSYTRHEGPNFMGYGKSGNRSVANYQHPNQYYQSYQQAPQTSSAPRYQDVDSNRNNINRKDRQPPRPHSADFLDHDFKKYYPNKERKDATIAENSGGKMDQYNSTRPPRPKSSLDIMHTNDGYYWSEERYAEKMRQSAMYLQNTLPQRSQSSRANTPNMKQEPNIMPNVKESRNGKPEQIPVVMRQKREDVPGDGTKSPSRQNLRRWSEHQDRVDNLFVRSASARLPKQRGQDDESDEVQAYTGGEDFNEGRKEESMKRLLEWKQRMLQSPLTRKSSGSSTRGVAQNELSKYYKQQVLRELERQEAKSREELGKKRVKPDGTRIQNRNPDGRRSAMLPSDRYYSYSSDDEENEERNEERTRRSSQPVKPRIDGEETKGRRNTPDPGKILTYTSPDYENIAQTQELLDGGRFSCFSPETGYGLDGKEKGVVVNDENTTTKKVRIPVGENEVPLLDVNSKISKASDNEYETLKQPGTFTEPGTLNPVKPTKPNYSGLGGQPQGVGTKKKENWNEKIDESKLIKEFSYQYIKDSKTPEKTTSISCKMLEAPPENIVKSRIKQLGLEGQEADGKEVIMKEPLKMSPPVYYLNEAHVSNLKNVDAKLQERRKDITKFALGEAIGIPEPTNDDVPEKHQKSVKDLLADFERKSQLAQEREALENEKSFEEVPGKRYVFSDTETLLYDTSSDTEDKKEGPDPSILTNLRRPDSRRGVTDELLTEEEDGDEEVAAALGRRERFFSSCRDLGRKRDAECAYRGKRLPKPFSAIVEPSPSSEVETIMTPGYLRSSLTESVAALENSDSTCSTPTIERIKDNLEKTLPKENLTKPVIENPPETEPCEGHYMPMTPSRRVSAPSSDKSRSNSSLHSFLFGVDTEETYVEMAENGISAHLEPNKSSLSKIRKSYLEHDSPGYCEIAGNNGESHYDFLYRSSSLREPEYMEVNTLLEILKEQDEKIKEHKDAVEDKSGKKQKGKTSQEVVPPTPPRSALPDILNSSSANQQNTKSDSSDADDESSKDLDSLDVPRHPRFSLSDTFRPASYYLGSTMSDRDRNMIRLPNPNENHDSSDSDLVSPPPIPTSPPPLEDLDTSLETERSLEIRPQNISKFKFGDKDASKKLWSKSFPLGQDLENCEDRRKKRRPVSEDILESLEESDQSFYEKPLVFSELDSIGSRNGLALDEECGDINLDQYLEELQLSSTVNAQLYSKSFSESIYKSSEKELHKNLMPKESINKTDANEKGLLKLKYPEEPAKVNEEVPLDRNKAGEEVQYENLQALFPPPPPELYESSNDQSDRESSLAFYRNVAFPDVPPPDNYCDVYEPSEAPKKTKICFDPDTLQHQENNENVAGKPSGSLENQGAPYYYSDIIKNDEEDFGSSSDRSISGMRGHLAMHRYQPLNNQRDDVQEPNQCGKRNDIGRKVNPISQNYLGQISNETPNDLDDMQKIQAELRTTSAHFMGAADKSGSVDVRNIYESDTLQRRKTSIPSDNIRPRTPDLHHPQGVARNLYPHGLRDKSTGPNQFANAFTPDREFSTVQNRARSRSMEGLLNDSGYFPDSGNRGRLPDQTSNNLATRTQPSRSQKETPAHHSRVDSCEGDDLWEKDALWRENLRKVSLRHTRSLDNLDDEASTSTNHRLTLQERKETTSGKIESGRRSVDYLTSPQTSACPTGRRSADHLSAPSRSKLTRDVTYVNDGFRRNRQMDLAREYEQDYREGKIRPRKRESEIQTVVELSDSGVLDCDDGVHYEKLTRNRVGVDRPVHGENYLEGYEWNEYRETFRRNQPEGKEVSPKQKPQSSFLGDCIHPTQPPPQQMTEGLAIEPIDREKLRQWDLMSSGTVEQEVEQNKVLDSVVQDPGKKGSVKKTDEIVSDGDLVEFSAAEHQPVEAQPQEESAQTSEASGSGSVMREPHLPLSASTTPQPGHPMRQIQKAPIHAAPPHPALTKEDNLKDQKLEQPNRTITDYNEKIDYYDRGKYPPAPNGFVEWNDSYPERRMEMNGGEDIIHTYPERGRPMTEIDYYTEQYQTRKPEQGYNRNCGTLPMVKPGGAVPVPSLNLQGSSVGRSVGTLDGRFIGKENTVKRKVSSSPWGLDVSAGELLGRTHEELVLLLIQLRRQSASVCKAMEACHIEIEEQARLAELDTPKRMEHIRKLEKLKKHLLELEKQYEKGKPLVNLVDNMVKLGSLYRGNSNVYNGTIGLERSSNVREKLEFNQKVQEQRLLAEERRDWDRLSPDHGQLQAKVQQLYRLDRLLQEESGTLHSLQQDKELLEKALGGLRHKLQVNRSNPAEADRYRKQQKLLEKELSRVRLLLAHNSKKLEETVAENARLEQELVILRQKLQASRVSSRSSVPLLPESATLSTTAALEAELRRVQQLVGDLQRQRHELSAQVKQLTEKSDTLVQQIRPGPTGVAGAGPIPGKKKSSATWLETDLDLLVTQDVGVESPVTSPHHQQQPPVVSPGSRSTTPIYINTETSKKDVLSPSEELTSPNKPITPTTTEENQSKTYCTPVELSEADERMKRFYGIIPREKQEIKTVRIVKRESERRQRDRDRSGNIGLPIGNTAVAKRVSVIEENDGYGLGRVEEESYENFHNTSNYTDSGEDYQKQKPIEYGVQEGNADPYMNFHPTNPFLPQNLSNNTEEISVMDRNVVATSPNQRSMSLPRGFGKSNPAVPPVRNESSSALRNFMTKRNRVRFENQYQDGSGSESGLNSPRNESPNRNYNSAYMTNHGEYNNRSFSKNGNSIQKAYGSNEAFSPTQMIRGLRLEDEEKERNGESSRPLTAREQLFGSNYFLNDEISPQLSPVYQSEAAREIILEMSNNPIRNNPNRRQIRKEKRRHHTVSNIRHVTDNDNHLSRLGSAKSRDDLDMERALRPRMNAPDVVRSTMNHKDLKYNESTIDNILGTPNKIVIPERYIPEQEPILTAEEQMQRLRKAESIRKMLSETTALSTPDLSGGLEEEKKSCTLRKKVEEEKKQREHLLELNQILAQQVMEKSKLVAVKAMATLPLNKNEGSFDEDDLSPVQPLPIYQQRENFFS